MDGEERQTLTIIIPTYNETPNIPSLFREFGKLRDRWHHPFHILIIDDSSPDGTGTLARTLGDAMGLPVMVWTRPPPRSLGGSITWGLALSEGELVCVMDADMSHPPSLLPLMVERLNGFDGVVSSRYTAGGRTSNWPRRRLAISRIATALARRIGRTTCTDPLSGYFLFRKSALRNIPITGIGSKPLLEIISRTNLATYDVPYEFRNRANGQSKLRLTAIIQFVHLLSILALRPPIMPGSVESRDPAKTSAPETP